MKCWNQRFSIFWIKINIYIFSRKATIFEFRQRNTIGYINHECNYLEKERQSCEEWLQLICLSEIDYKSKKKKINLYFFSATNHKRQGNKNNNKMNL